MLVLHLVFVAILCSISLYISVCSFSVLYQCVPLEDYILELFVWWEI